MLIKNRKSFQIFNTDLPRIGKIFQLPIQDRSMHSRIGKFDGRCKMDGVTLLRAILPQLMIKINCNYARKE